MRSISFQTELQYAYKFFRFPISMLSGSGKFFVDLIQEVIVGKVRRHLA